MALAVSPRSIRDGPFASASLFACATGAADGRIVLTLRGEADASTEEVLSDALLRIITQGSVDVVIDLADLVFLGVGSGRLLVNAGQILARKGGTLHLRAPSRMARRVLDMVGVAGLVEGADEGRP